MYSGFGKMGCGKCYSLQISDVVLLFLWFKLENDKENKINI